MNTCIENVKVVIPGERVIPGGVRIANGTVAAIGVLDRREDDAVVDGGGRTLTPGLVDVHIHGIETYRFDSDPDELRAGAGCFARFGATTVLPTVVPRRGPKMLDNLSLLAGALDGVAGANLPGLHLEGPFVAIPGAGCDVVPGDLGLLEEILAACRGRARVMSLSPDTPGILPVIERLREEGVAPFVTHTRADLEQSLRAIEAGARHATHLYDVFPIPPERDPGVRPVGAVEAYLADPRTTVDFIADGCHVAPIAIQLAVRAKTCLGVALVTDANIGAGLPPGVYDTPWGYKVTVEPGKGARILEPGTPRNGSLAGSALTMNVGMANLLEWISAPPEMIWAMGTRIPARAAGLDDAVGSLAVGGAADLVLWNADWTPAMTWVRGERVYCDC